MIDRFVADLLASFTYDHLPPRLQEISRPYAEHAQRLAELPLNWHTLIALQRLLESKDAAVRAALETMQRPDPAP